MRSNNTCLSLGVFGHWATDEHQSAGDIRSGQPEGNQIRLSETGAETVVRSGRSISNTERPWTDSDGTQQKPQHSLSSGERLAGYSAYSAAVKTKQSRTVQHLREHRHLLCAPLLGVRQGEGRVRRQQPGRLAFPATFALLRSGAVLVFGYQKNHARHVRIELGKWLAEHTFVMMWLF